MSTWTGGFVSEELGITVQTDARRSALALDGLVGLALRRNPRRAHLIVSTVLAKHVPTDPNLVIAAGSLLGELVGHELERPAASISPSRHRVELGPGTRDHIDRLEAALRAGDPGGAQARELRVALEETRRRHPDVVTIGFAETATALGRQVADQIGSYYVHSTRHAGAGAGAVAFEEAHSHATSHRILASDSDWLRPSGTVVLVDDELTSGSTAVNTIRALHDLAPQSRWVVAALVDLRSDADRERFDELALELATQISVVSLGAGTVTLPPGTAARATVVIDSLAARVSSPTPPEHAPPQESRDLASVAFLALTDTVSPIFSDRFGTHPHQRASAPAAADAIAAALTAALGPTLGDGGSMLLLGTEEFMSLPIEVASRLPGCRFSTTTRSPIAAIDRPDYAIATAITFRSHDETIDGPGARFAYNLTRAGREFDTIVVMPEPGTDSNALTGAGSLTESLRTLCRRLVVVLLPAAAARDSVTVRSTSASVPISEQG